MSNSVQDYLNLITSEHQGQPNFAAVVSLRVSVYVQLQALYESMIPIFDISENPVGNQEDIIGQWVGVSRLIQNPFSDIFFTWNGTSANGWDYGIWQSPDNPDAIVSLPDDVYLNLIKARIAANSWNGTTTQAYAIWAQLFPGLTLIYQDYQNMSFLVAVQGYPLDSLTEALLVGGYLPLRPEGVEIVGYVVPVDDNPLFGWDVDTASLQGWNLGSWGAEVAPT